MDLSGALAMDGVYAAVSGADFPQSEHGEVGGEGGGDVITSYSIHYTKLYDARARGPGP